jgi:diaminopimelate epimerase
MLLSFAKYHALGNDYIVINPKDLPSPLTAEQIKLDLPQKFWRRVGRDSARAVAVEEGEVRAAHFQPRRQRGGKERERPADFFALFVGQETWSAARNFPCRNAREELSAGNGHVSAEKSCAWKWATGEFLERRDSRWPGRDAKSSTSKYICAGEQYHFCAATVGNPHCVLPFAENQRGSGAANWAAAGNARALSRTGRTCS